ncbi:MAG: Lrp/AsnC family transcriptional regulator [Burkholderiaceae bacterium]
MLLETKDLALLALLQKDSSASNAELAEQVGMSASACYRRTRALESAGVIKRQVAVLDPIPLGLRFSAIVQISLSRHDRGHVQTFVERLLTRPEVIEAFATTGEADYHLRVVTENADAYNAFLDEFLLGLPGVSRIQTNLVLKEIKQTYELPLPAA